MAYLHICDVCKCKLPDNDEKVIRVIIEPERNRKSISSYIPEKPYSLNIEICEDCAIEMHDMILPLTTKAEEIVNELLDGESHV